MTLNQFWWQLWQEKRPFWLPRNRNLKIMQIAELSNFYFQNRKKYYFAATATGVAN